MREPNQPLERASTAHLGALARVVDLRGYVETLLDPPGPRRHRRITDPGWLPPFGAPYSMSDAPARKRSCRQAVAQVNVRVAAVTGAAESVAVREDDHGPDHIIQATTPRQMKAS